MALNVSADHLIRTIESPDQCKDKDHCPQPAGRYGWTTRKRTGFHRPMKSKIWQTIADLLTDVDIVIVSDYAKGLLSESLLSQLIAAAGELEKMVIVDPKGKDYSRYKGAALLTPNRREAAEACNLDEDLPDLVNIAGKQLLDKLGLNMVLITQGEEGMTLFQKDRGPVHLGAAAKEIYDVTGAGDTVIACLGVGLGVGSGF